MRTIICALALIVSAFSPTLYPLSASNSGVSGASLSNAPTTSAIQMWADQPLHQLSLTLAVTPGSTTAITVQCFQSQDAVTWGAINPCDNSTPNAVCAPDIRGYTLANYSTVTIGGFTGKIIKSNWVITEAYAQCTANGTGSGSVTITGVRS